MQKRKSERILNEMYEQRIQVLQRSKELKITINKINIKSHDFRHFNMKETYDDLEINILVHFNELKKIYFWTNFKQI